jgi:hypothetical protein
VILYYRPIKNWPEGWQEMSRDDSPWTPFKSTWESTLKLLDTELNMLGATEATLQLDTAERNCRADGGLRGDARVDHHGVILSFDSAKHGRLTYPCAAFDAPRDPWRQNVRAIALGLESLRRVERYGIADRGQQYAGWAELGTGIAAGGAGTSSMTLLEAAEIIAQDSVESPLSGRPVFTPDDVLRSAVKRRAAFRLASLRLHPDQEGGNSAAFIRLQAAKDLLDSAAEAG